MKSRWNESEALHFAADVETGLRVYSSRLLGLEPDLVLHGGGNTSVKGTRRNVFGTSERVLYIKGSGWDLRTIEKGGFPPVRLDYLQALAVLPELTDTQMMQHLRLALLEPGAPAPSVEAILHALIPHAYVDHTHADAVVALSNTPHGDELLREIYGEQVLILPYIMPGFILAKQVYEATRKVDWKTLQGIILLHHGIVTFAEDARSSYEAMINLVSKAEDYLHQHKAAEHVAKNTFQALAADYLQLATLRQNASNAIGHAVLLRWDTGSTSVGYSCLDNVADLATRGPLTPDHSLHTKPFAAVAEQDLVSSLSTFASSYQDYFEHHSAEHHQCLDLLPRVIVWRDKGMVYLAPDCKRLGIVADIYQHTLQSVQWAEALGGWSALPRQDQFDLEYWELEQAKLKSAQLRKEFAGKVVLVSGAASGIGKACGEAFLAAGACVLALDIDAKITEMFTGQQALGLCCDLTDQQAVSAALRQAITHFGGLDILVSNAGFLPESQSVERLDDVLWERSLQINLSAHMQLLRTCTPFLQRGVDPAVIVIASKNVPAPGPGAAAYSVAKAGLTQLARIAALELAEFGIRVNTIHPNAVFDTALWTEEVIASRAARYGMSAEEYRSNTLLGKSVRSADVAAMAVLMAGQGFSRTTGAQVAVDGGNTRVI